MDRRRIHRKRRIKIKRGIRLPFLLLILILVPVGAVIFLINSREVDEFSMEYVNTREIAGFMQFTYYDKDEWKQRLGMEFTGALTYRKLADLLEFLNVKEYVVYESERDGKRVNRETWNQVYEQILGILDTSGKVTKEKILLLGLPDGTAVETQMGVYQYDGALTKQYQSYEAYVMEDKLLGILRELEEELTVENVYVTDTQENITFLYRNNTYQIPIETEQEIADIVCDISMQNGNITKIRKKEDSIEGKLLTLEDKKIEIEGYGRIERAADLPVYQVYGDREEKSISDIVLGNMNISYIVAEKRVCAILLKEPPEIRTVRVLLLNEDQGIGRETVHVKADGIYHLSWGKESADCEGGVVCDMADYLANDPDVSLKIEGDENVRLYLCDENGSQTSLPYAGSFEIRKNEEGYVVVNVLSLEEYLCGVVPSEMPSNYPAEALKAQAVCARSYAGIQMLKGAYAKYGAHMDDSVNYQVYNKQEQAESTTQAVLDTSGKVIAAHGNILEAYYYSTSFGHSGSYESWNQENDGSLDYLRGTWLKEEEPDLDLADEAVFAQYIQSDDETCYDSLAKYFRWNALLDLTEKSAVIRETINARKSANPKSILIYSNDAKAGEDMSSASSLGEVNSIITEGRNSCGGVKKLVVNFEDGKVDILDEYSMRIVLGCVITQLTFRDDSTAENVSVLPSSYFVITSSENGNYTLRGGGYGHGIGMSQNGAKGMAEQEYTYEEILKKFYSDIEIKDIVGLKGDAA